MTEAAAVTGILVGYGTKSQKNEASGLVIRIELDDYAAKQFHRAFPDTHVAVAVVRMLDGGGSGTEQQESD
jgi:outer membrane lipoprotein SlyB